MSHRRIRQRARVHCQWRATLRDSEAQVGVVIAEVILCPDPLGHGAGGETDNPRRPRRYPVHSIGGRGRPGTVIKPDRLPARHSRRGDLPGSIGHRRTRSPGQFRQYAGHAAGIEALDRHYVGPRLQWHREHARRLPVAGGAYQHPVHIHLGGIVGAQGNRQIIRCGCQRQCCIHLDSWLGHAVTKIRNRYTRVLQRLLDIRDAGGRGLILKHGPGTGNLRCRHGGTALVEEPPTGYR